MNKGLVRFHKDGTAVSIAKNNGWAAIAKYGMDVVAFSGTLSDKGNVVCTMYVKCGNERMQMQQFPEQIIRICQEDANGRYYLNPEHDDTLHYMDEADLRNFCNWLHLMHEVVQADINND